LPDHNSGIVIGKVRGMKRHQLASAPFGPLEGNFTRRNLLGFGAGALAGLALSGGAAAQSSKMPFVRWVQFFRGNAQERGISGAVYDRVMTGLKPDDSVFELDRAQPEFQEELWQYLNRRVSDWRITAGKARAKEYAALLERVEREYGVDRRIMLGVWGMESAFGDIVTNPKHMRPIFPALAALAWGEPRRRKYWEQELLNALVIVERGWAAPEEMIGSWAGAMGHTQWMPEVWLNMGVDFNRDGKISPFGAPDDAIAGTARYFVERGGYKKGEGWGYEVRAPERVAGKARGKQTIAKWHAAGVTRANGKPFPRPQEQARLWQPVPGGPLFLLTHNFDAVKSYNPANAYTLAVCHLGDCIAGEGPLVQEFPGGERLPTLAEIQEIQQRLTSLGFDSGGTDGRVGKDTTTAIRNFQAKTGMKADGYAGLKLLARLREAS
jgi:membrane-bound lytic murein transglycosylase B